MNNRQAVLANTEENLISSTPLWSSRGSGHEVLRSVNIDFETVIIDEAAQSVEGRKEKTSPANMSPIAEASQKKHPKPEGRQLTRFRTRDAP